MVGVFGKLMVDGSTYGSIVEVQVWAGERDTTQKGMRISCTSQTGEWRKYERDLEDGNGNGKGDEVLGPGQEGFMTTGASNARRRPEHSSWGS